MNRRCVGGLDQGNNPVIFGSLREFGSAAYDFKSVPVKGAKILAEQGEKVINVLYEVKDIADLPFVEKNKIAPSKSAIASLEDYITALSLIQ